MSKHLLVLPVFLYSLLRLKEFNSRAALLVIIISLILKYLEDCHIGRNLEPVISSETNQLLPGKSNPFSYGTWDTDIESGNCSSSLEELYDEKICIICYDEKRNCFFVPCGHCATCYQCAKRYVFKIYVGVFGSRSYLKINYALSRKKN